MLRREPHRFLELHGLEAEKISKWGKHLSHKQDSLSLSPWNSCKARCILTHPYFYSKIGGEVKELTRSSQASQPGETENNKETLP